MVRADAMLDRTDRQLLARQHRKNRRLSLKELKGLHNRAGHCRRALERAKAYGTQGDVEYWERELEEAKYGIYLWEHK